MNDKNINQLSEILEHQHALFLEMRNIVLSIHDLCQQVDFSDKESINRLDRCIQLRQQQMQKIEANQCRLVKTLSQLSEQYGTAEIYKIGQLFSLPVTVTSSLNEVATNIIALMREIETLDISNRRLLRQKMDLVKEKAFKLHKRLQVCRAYRPSGIQPNGIFFDRKQG